jgi:tRNA nucleotidyltransferase (CCA-adding enzyme)
MLATHAQTDSHFDNKIDSKESHDEKEEANVFDTEHIIKNRRRGDCGSEVVVADPDGVADDGMPQVKKMMRHMLQKMFWGFRMQTLRKKFVDMRQKFHVLVDLTMRRDVEGLTR